MINQQAPLDNKNWSFKQILEISVPGGSKTNQSCEIYNYDYEKLSDMSFDSATDYVNNMTTKPELISCFSKKQDDYYFYYDQDPDVSFVPEWNLVCERTALRSNIQVALSIGNNINAFNLSLFCSNALIKN